MRTEVLEGLASRLLTKLGIPEEKAKAVAQSLVAADMEGIPSHGVMLLPMYVDRMLAGSVSKKTEGTVVTDGGFATVIDAGHALGQLTALQAVDILKKKRTGAVAVRNGFHFGTAGYWARMLAADGLIGIVMCNTRPLMPAPGAAERVVGNNPLAIALPGNPEFVTDMAMSASAMGKIRLAASAGKPIPEGWAADESGAATTDAAKAIKGMLLPAAGPKGFGLAAAIDLLCGGLAGGAIGDEVGMLYGDPAKPYACAHLFVALDPAGFGAADFASRVTRFSHKIRQSKPAPGTTEVFAPGDVERAKRARHGSECPVAQETLAQLQQCAAKVGVSFP